MELGCGMTGRRVWVGVRWVSGGRCGMQVRSAREGESYIDLIESRERENGSQCLLGSAESVDPPFSP